MSIILLDTWRSTLQVNKTGLPSQCQYPLSICNPLWVFQVRIRCWKCKGCLLKECMRSSFSFWYMWFLFLKFLAEKDLLILLEMAKYFEMLFKLRYIEPNHIILLRIHQYWAMLFDVLHVWPIIRITFAEYWKMLLDSYCMLFHIVRLVFGVCHLLSITCYLLLFIWSLPLLVKTWFLSLL